MITSLNILVFNLIFEIILIIAGFVVCFAFRLKMSAFVLILFFHVNTYFAAYTAVAAQMFLLDVVGHVEGGGKVAAAAEALPLVL